MPEYEYQALDQKGKSIRGRIEAPHEEIVIERLRSMGYFPTQVRRREQHSGGLTLRELPGLKLLCRLFTAQRVEDVPEERRTFALPSQEEAPAPGELPAASPAPSCAHRLLEPRPAWKAALRSWFGKTDTAAHASRQCLGFEMGTASLRWALIEASDRGVQLARVGLVPLQVSPNAPAPERVDAAAAAVKREMEQQNITLRQTVYCVSRESATFERFQVPTVSKARLERIVLYEANQRLPSSPSQVFLYDVLGQSPPSVIDILLVAVPRQPLEDYLALVAKLGLTAAGLCLSSFDEFAAKDVQLLHLKRKVQCVEFILAPADR